MIRAVDLDFMNFILTEPREGVKPQFDIHLSRDYMPEHGFALGVEIMSERPAKYGRIVREAGLMEVTMIRHIVVICAMAFLLAGCVRTQVINFETTTRSAKPLDALVEVLEKEQIKNPYKVIGIVRANAGKLADPNSALEKMREAAREMGGDALTEFGVEDARSGVIVPMGSVAAYGNLRINYAAKVIVFETPSGR